MIGRGLRLNLGKTDCLVIDTVGMSRRTDLVTLSRLLAARSARRKRPALMLDGLELLPPPPEEMADAEERQQPEAVKLVYRPFDLRTYSRLNWIENKHGQAKVIVKLGLEVPPTMGAARTCSRRT